MSVTRPEGVAIVSNATEPTTRMLMRPQKSVASGQSDANPAPKSFQVFPYNQRQLLFFRRWNLRPIGDDGMRQRRSAFARPYLWHCLARGLDDFRGVLGVLRQHGNDLLHGH